MSKTAILLLAHGTPNSPDEVPAYLNNVTGGRPVPESVLQEVRHRYSSIGGSPLTEITFRQAEVLQHKLQIPVYVGMRNWHPFIAETVQAMIADGVTELVSICLAPQASRTSVGLYKRALMLAATDNLQIVFIESWHDHPGLIHAFAHQLKTLLGSFNSRVPVIFTAHSVPCRTILSSNTGAGDPYGIQARQTAALVAQRAGFTDKDWFFAFQSQGISGGPWIGPNVEQTIEALASQRHKRVIVQTIGFVSDHVEVLYDIDVAFRAFAQKCGMELFRPRSLNDSPEFITALAELAASRLKQAVHS